MAFLGGIDTVVISAGAGGRTPCLNTPPEEFQRIIDNNLRPLFLAVRYAGAHLIAAGRGSVIAISSTYGLVGHKERVAYCGAKAGMIGMVKAMALDLAEKGVRVNAICPGFVETPLAREVAQAEPDPEAVLEAKRRMHPVPRAGRLEEMGELAIYLASDVAAFVTGQAIAIDGGYSAQ
jgi:NAD(P)-dependent dehydrogenase (short-subunit alcohol dehydrogenase family)